MQTVLLHSTEEGTPAADASAVLVLGVLLAHDSPPVPSCGGGCGGGRGCGGGVGLGASGGGGGGGLLAGRPRSRALCLLAEIDLITGEAVGSRPRIT